ncbi:oxidoreductase [Fusarium heterosporum]|uniref:Oxidoreductase n=1 Tax=Fusarium heterosporum TaxID=42747 RepID=A0A8H5TP71_FUSHE|nr:oxidoreductase [Fusarium heterosporum]
MAIARYGDEVVDPAPLLEPLDYVFSGRQAPNRFLKAAMSEKLATWDSNDVSARGYPTKELITLYRNWGAGGWGSILTSNVIIDGMNLEAPGNLTIPADATFDGARFEAYKELATETKKSGNLLIAQVSHAGRQVEEWVQPNPISASDVQLTAGGLSGRSYGAPRPATEEDIATVINGFAHAAEFLEKAGFDGIELHGAHGYLLAQFLSPRTNKRTDKYGGSPENRMRLVLEVIAEIKRRVSPSFIVGIKANSIEYTEGGIQVEDACALAIELEKAKVDFLELSGGNYEKFAFAHVKEENKKRENYFLVQADEIMKGLKREMKVFSTGGFKSVKAMVDSLSTIDGVGLGRAATQEPRFPETLKKKSITGTVEQRFDHDDVMKRFAAAGVQISQIADNQEPVDLSKQENADGLWNDVMKYFQEASTDLEHKMYKWPAVTQVVFPYGESEM